MKALRELLRFFPYLTLLVIGLVVFTPVMQRATTLDVDFGDHIALALKMPSENTNVSHVLFHGMFLTLRQLLPSYSNQDIALIVMLAVMVPLPIIVFVPLKKCSAGSIPDYALVGLSLGVTIMAPITIWSQKWLIGYINPTIYHNPTTILLLLFVIPISLLAQRVYDNQPYRNRNHRVYTLMLCASLLLISTLAKQSYTIVLIPGCVAYAVFRRLKNKSVDWVLLVLGICLPGMAILGLEYLVTYVDLADGGSIAVGFMKFMLHYIPAWRIPLQFVLSLLFPLSVLLYYGVEARKDLYLKISWIVFGVSAFMSYFLHEEGARWWHGNFVWSSHTAILVLMFASLLFFVNEQVREIKQQQRGEIVSRIRLSSQAIVVLFCFALHVVYGIKYYLLFF